MTPTRAQRAHIVFLAYGATAVALFVAGLITAVATAPSYAGDIIEAVAAVNAGVAAIAWILAGEETR